ESKRIGERQRVLVASVQCVRGSIDLEHRNGSRRRAALGEIAAHEPADGHNAGNMVGKPAAEHLSEKAAVRNPGCGHVRGINAVLIPEEIDQGTNECNIIDSGLLRWSCAARYRPALPVAVRKENCEPMRIPDVGEMRDTAHLTAGHWPAVKRDDKRRRLEARSIRRKMEPVRPCDTAGIHGSPWPVSTVCAGNPSRRVSDSMASALLSLTKSGGSAGPARPVKRSIVLRASPVKTTPRCSRWSAQEPDVCPGTWITRGFPGTSTISPSANAVRAATGTRRATPLRTLCATK